MLNQLKPKTMEDLSREWTTEQKMGFVNRMETLPEGVNKYEYMMTRCGVPKKKYNGWLKRYGVSSIYAPVLDNIRKVNPEVVSMFKVHPKIMERMTEKMKRETKGKKFLYNVNITIEVGSLDELTEIVTNLQNVPNVHNINSVKYD